MLLNELLNEFFASASIASQALHASHFPELLSEVQGSKIYPTGKAEQV